jgi:nucleotide-binding universal stress UspA family protein
MGAWLHETTGAALQAIHVAAVPSLPRRYREELEGGLRQVLDRQIAEAGLADELPHPEVRLGKHVDRDLVDRATALDAGLLIGRSAPRSAGWVVRLGRVARRVLRRLPGVVAVVPPDLKRSDVGSGPVMLAIDPHGDGADAVAFARELAATTKRELVAVHVFDGYGEAAIGAVPPDLARRCRLAWQQEAGAALDDFVRRHELAGVKLLTSEGSAVDQLLEIAKREQASMIVCGSRRLSTSERVFEGSVGSLLAATADVPVFVVPPSGE